MSKFIEFHDEQGVKILTHTEGLVLRLTTELEISNSINTWKITNNPQTAYVNIRAQLGMGISGNNPGRKKQKVSVNGVVYDSVSIAAAAMNITQPALSQLLAKGGDENIFRVED